MIEFLKSRFSESRGYFSRMAPQRQRFLIASGVTFMILMAFLAIASIRSQAEGIVQSNNEIYQVLDKIKKYGELFLLYRWRQDELDRNLSETGLELNSYVDRAASLVQAKIEESSQTPVVEGRGFRRRGMQITLRKLKISRLTELLRSLESPRKPTVQITSLSIDTRWGEKGSLDIEMEVSAYEKAKRTRSSKAKRKSTTRRGKI